MIGLRILLLHLAIAGCALTAPKGEKVLLDDIHQDRQARYPASKELVGKPIFLKVRAYPHMEDGNIYGPQWILLQTSRESLDMERLLRSLEE